MKILVTGANGFVGSHLCPFLLSASHSVLGAVRRRDPSVGSGIDTVEIGPIESFDDWDPIMRKVDVVVHLAARVHIMDEKEADPEQRFQSVNALATERLARAAAKAGVRRLVYLSSVKVNGESTASKPFTACDSPAPQDAYGRSKLAAEVAIRHISEQFPMDFTIIRPPLIYGPGVGGNMLRLMRYIERGVPMPLASVHNARSLVSVWTLCDLIARCLDASQTSNRTLMVSDDTDLSTPALIRYLARGIGKPARLFAVPPMLLRAACSACGRRAEFDRLAGSLQIDQAITRELLGWVPPASVETALERTGRWFSAQTQRNSRARLE